MTIGDKVKKLRDYLELSMESFGDILGVSKHTVSNWEKGKREPTERMRESLNDLAKRSHVKLNFTENNLVIVTYKECTNCHYKQVEQEFSFCPMCGEAFVEIDLKECEAMLLEYYHIDQLIKEAEFNAMYPDKNPDMVKRNAIFEPISNKEEMNAIRYAQRSNRVRRLQKVKERVPLAFKQLSGLEKEVISYLYCTSDFKKKTYSKVIKITGLDIVFIQQTDIKMLNEVGNLFLH